MFDYRVRYGDIGRDLTGSEPAFDPLEAKLNIAYVSPQDIADALHSINNMPPKIKEYLQILTGFKKPKA